jgi:hypothetical protein
VPALGFRVGRRAVVGELGIWGSRLERGKRGGGVGGFNEAEGVRQRCWDSKFFEFWVRETRGGLGNGRWRSRGRDRAAEIEPAGVIQMLLSDSDRLTLQEQVGCVWTLA